jgi:hypothetical protein
MKVLRTSLVTQADAPTLCEGKLIDLEQAAFYLGTSERHVRTLWQERRIAGIKGGYVFAAPVGISMSSSRRTAARPLARSPVQEGRGDRTLWRDAEGCVGDGDRRDLGHSSSRMTLDIYARVTVDADRKEADAMSASLRPSRT